MKSAQLRRIIDNIERSEEADFYHEAFEQGKAYENIEWLEGHRCFECGKEKEASTSDLCGECLEEK